MSVDNNVFMIRGNMPTARVWAEAIRSHGFKLAMDPNYNLSKFEGFLPCTYRGVEAGFEFWAEEVDLDQFLEDEYLKEDERSELGDCDFMVTLSTRASYRDLVASTVAAAVLTELSCGFLAEGGTPPFIKDVDATKWAKECLEGLEQEL